MKYYLLAHVPVEASRNLRKFNVVESVDLTLSPTTLQQSGLEVVISSNFSSPLCYVSDQAFPRQM